MIFKA